MYVSLEYTFDIRDSWSESVYIVNHFAILTGSFFGNLNVLKNNYNIDTSQSVCKEDVLSNGMITFNKNCVRAPGRRTMIMTRF